MTVDEPSRPSFVATLPSGGSIQIGNVATVSVARVGEKIRVYVWTDAHVHVDNTSQKPESDVTDW